MKLLSRQKINQTTFPMWSEANGFTEELMDFNGHNLVGGETNIEGKNYQIFDYVPPVSKTENLTI